jgi:uncharacterized protein
MPSLDLQSTQRFGAGRGTSSCRELAENETAGGKPVVARLVVGVSRKSGGTWDADLCTLPGMGTSRDERFRILSLDGGGTWALIQVKALMRLYGPIARGSDVLRRFDLVISNSGGSIVLAALAGDMLLADILGLFEQKKSRESMFVSLLLGPALKSVHAGPRYEAAKKLDGLREALGSIADTQMKEWEQLTNDAGRPVRLVICGFDYDRLREVFFRTHPEPLDLRGSEKLPKQAAVVDATFAEAVHASSNAPVVYFNEPAVWGRRDARFWDGAMGGYNNPALAGVVEAVRDQTLDRANIRVLSIGTGSVVLPEAGRESEYGLVLPARGSGFLTYAATAGTCILDDPPDAASLVAHVMLGGWLPHGKVVTNGPVVRMSPLVQPVAGAGADWVRPRGLDPTDFAALVAMDMDAVDDSDVKKIGTLADAWLAGGLNDPTAVRNQPIRASRWLEVEIGHGTFGEAAKAWKELGDPSAWALSEVTGVGDPDPLARP